MKSEVTSTSTKELLKIAEQEEEAAEEAHHAARKRTKELQDRICFETYQVRVGSIVKNTEGKIFKVRYIGTYSGWCKPSLDGYPQKKDGTFGVVSQYIRGDWEVIKP